STSKCAERTRTQSSACAEDAGTRTQRRRQQRTRSAWLTDKRLWPDRRSAFDRQQLLYPADIESRNSLFDFVFASLSSISSMASTGESELSTLRRTQM